MSGVFWKSPGQKASKKLRGQLQNYINILDPLLEEHATEISKLKMRVAEQDAQQRNFAREINYLNEKVEGIMKLYTTSESGVTVWNGEGGRKRKRKTKKRKRGKSPKRTKRKKRGYGGKSPKVEL